MKKTILFVVSLFAFLLLANSADAQMHSVSVKGTMRGSKKHQDINTMRVNLPATGTSDSDYPKVSIARPGARVWTLGELREFLPTLAVAINPKYTDVGADNVTILRTEFGKDYLSMEIHIVTPSVKKKGYNFNAKKIFWCDLNEYGEIVKSGQRKLGYYYTKASR